MSDQIERYENLRLSSLNRFASLSEDAEIVLLLSPTTISSY